MQRASLETIVHQRLAQPGWAEALANYVDGMRQGVYPHAKLVCQTDRRLYDIYDAYVFAHFHAWLMTGQIALAEFTIGAEPVADRHIKEMNRLLSAAFPDYDVIESLFWGGTQGADGKIVLKRKFDFGIYDKTNQVGCVPISGLFPLEVGTLPAHKAMICLGQPGGKLARWPYGAEVMTLMVRRKDDCKDIRRVCELARQRVAQTQPPLFAIRHFTRTVIIMGTKDNRRLWWPNTQVESNEQPLVVVPSLVGKHHLLLEVALCV